jgi:hypothetical protein
MFRAPAAVVAGLMLAIASLAPAAEPSLQTSTMALNPDVLFDYDLYVADSEPRFGWVLVYTFADNSTIEYGPYTNYSDASWRLWFNVEHNIHTNAVDVEIVEEELPPVWQFVQRYGTYAAAADMADLFENFGFLSDIRPVSALRIRTTISSLSR